MSESRNDKEVLSLLRRLVDAVEEIADNTRPAEIQTEFEYDDPDRVPDFMGHSEGT